MFFFSYIGFIGPDVDVTIRILPIAKQSKKRSMCIAY